MWAAILGALQGVTEFIPVSSSGHLAILQSKLNFEEPPVLFDALLHLATLLAVLWMFRDRVMQLFCVKPVSEEVTAGKPAGAGSFHAVKRYWTLIIAATIPTVIVGLLLDKGFEKVTGVDFKGLFHNSLAAGIALIITAGILFLPTRRKKAGKRTLYHFGIAVAVILGVAQGIAIFPGISRSGTTICLALLLGLSRPFAAEFSFLMSVPAIIGANIYTLLSGDITLGMPVGAAVVGFISAAIFGYLALFVTVKIVKVGKLHYFAPYCLLLGLIAIIFLR
jgi:undecaprenyl-diphosphatase